jgi:hypothetical protein
MVFHLIPISAFSTSKTHDVIPIYEKDFHRLPLIGFTRWDRRLNLDGVVTFSNEEGKLKKAYTQLYRSGIIEVVSVFEFKDKNGYFITSHDFEKYLILATQVYLKLLCDLEIEPPIYVFLTLAGVLNYRFAVGNRFPRGSSPLDRDVLSIPEVVINSYDSEPHTILRPIFDMVWNCFGFERSFNYDEKGDWKYRI